jgi:protein TonB
MAEEGRVVLKVTIGADGKVGVTGMAQSSGYERLDRAAECVIYSLPFSPGMRDGQPVESHATLPIVFSLP